jgi:hypothetical protein
MSTSWKIDDEYGTHHTSRSNIREFCRDYYRQRVIELCEQGKDGSNELTRAVSHLKFWQGMCDLGSQQMRM